jgi:hypothetical protein
VIGAPGGGGARGQVYVVPDPLAVGLRVALPARDLCPLLRTRRMPVRVTTIGSGRVSLVVNAGPVRSRRHSLSARRSATRFVAVGLPAASAGNGEPVTVTAVAIATRAGAPITHASASRTVTCARPA